MGTGVTGAFCRREIISRKVASLVVITRVLRSIKVQRRLISPVLFCITRASWFSTILSTKPVWINCVGGVLVATPCSGMCGDGV